MSHEGWIERKRQDSFISLSAWRILLRHTFVKIMKLFKKLERCYLFKIQKGESYRKIYSSVKEKWRLVCVRPSEEQFSERNTLGNSSKNRS